MRPFAALSSVAYAWASDTGGSGKAVLRPRTRKSSLLARPADARTLDSVTTCISGRPEDGVGRAGEGKLSLGLGLLHSSPAHLLRCQKPAESQRLRTLQAGRKGKGRARDPRDVARVTSEGG